MITGRGFLEWMIAAMLGTPDSDLEQIRHLTDAKLHITADKPFDRSTCDELAVQLGEYFLEQARARRKNPTDDIMSALVTMEFTDDAGMTRKLRDVEAVSYISLLSGAGNETTARFTGWAGSVLALFPEQRAKLVGRPGADPQRSGGDSALRAAGYGVGPGGAARRGVVRPGGAGGFGDNGDPGGHGPRSAAVS